jgi:hypothetical protein
VLILYSIQLYGVALPKMFAPLTDPPGGAVVVPDGAPAAVVAAVVPPVAGVVGLVLEHPAIVTAITTSTIAMILTREIFKTTPSIYDENA